MSQIRKQSFIQGAFILVCAHVLVKVIGMIFKLPLANLINEDGMGLFGTAYNVYTFMFVVATAGFPTAISKMISESIALGKKRDADRIFSIAIFMLATIGVIGSVALYAGAYAFADKLGNSRAALGIMTIAPAVLCVSLISSFRGYFQGHQNMYPTAISEVLEALGKLLIGYALAAYLMQKSIEAASAGAIFGVTCGTFLSLGSLIVIYVIHKRKIKLKTCEPARPYRSIAKELVIIAVPITIGASVASLTNLIDMFTVMKRLQSIAQVSPDFINAYHSLIDFTKFNGGIFEELANKLYGLYTGFALPLFAAPQTIVVALSVSVVPAISGALALNDKRSAIKTLNSVIRITMLFALPCAVGLFVLAEPILMLLFNKSVAAVLLKELSISVIFVSLVQVTSSVLQAYGKERIPVINMFLGGIIKIIINYTLVAIPAVNIQGAPIGTAVCYFSIALMNFIWISKVSGMKFDIMGFLIKPAASAAIMGIVIQLLYSGAVSYGFTSRLISVPVIAIGGAVYVAAAFITGAVRREDVEMMPKGAKMAGMLEKFRLLK